MNKLLIAMALCAALAACKKDDVATDAAPAADAPTTDAAATDAPAGDAMAPADTPADPAAAGTGDVAVAGAPKECQEYINRFKACLDKANPQMAAQFKTQLEQAETQWANVDAAGAEAAANSCKQANDQFAQIASAMSCE